MTSILGKRILVVDDDAALLRALKKVLTSEGASVASASWVGEVMERLGTEEEGFDLILTDLRMPVLKGQSILRAFRSGLPEVPVIVMTAFGSPDIQAECLADGAAAFLEKPLDTSQLLAAVDRVLSAGKSRCGWPTHRWRRLRRRGKSNRTSTKETSLA